MNKNNIKDKVSEFWDKNGEDIKAIAWVSAICGSGIFCGYQVGVLHERLRNLTFTIESIHKF